MGGALGRLIFGWLGPPRGRHAFGARPRTPASPPAPVRSGPRVRLIFADGTVENLPEGAVREHAARLADKLFPSGPRPESLLRPDHGSLSSPAERR